MTREDCKFPVCPYNAEGDQRCKDKCQQPKKPKWYQKVKKKLAEFGYSTGVAIGEAKFDR